ncbi:hypothetical protein [Sulfurimonas sp.]|uniref:hypothetical protein n=1 Tax=Sulfurimonas sp. TaxID=2022749 RepID=UPI0025EDC5EF|nr:hypothetical protein [Sulfurimonas sp.]
MLSHPMQPIEDNGQKLARFKSNSIVKHLIENSSINLNNLDMSEFEQKDQEQFAQLIGYSLRAYGELEYVSNEFYEF